MPRGRETQLELFHLAPRNEGKTKVDWSKGGIRSLRLQRFKRFREFSISFDRLTLLVGGNSSGKTSILQAIRLFFWCIGACARRTPAGYTFTKAVKPFSDFHLIPAHDLRELANRGLTPNRRKLGIVLSGTLESGLVLSFRIYASYSTLMVVDPEQQPAEVITEEQLSQIDRLPLYIPGFFGVVTRELLAHDARLEELLNSGHHNEVLRNIILRLKGNRTALVRLLEIVRDEFKINDVDLPFSDKETEFLRAEYSEPGMKIPLDFVSAGSGFLQVLQIMAHALQNPSPILLLDEPDAHMHHNLQKSFLRVLRSFADQEKLQVVMASHSETFLREAPLEEIRVVDPSWQEAGEFRNAPELEDELRRGGIWPTHLELAEIMRTRRVLLVEGEDDGTLLQRLGHLKYKDWHIRRRLLQIVCTDGSQDNTVKRLEYVQEILQRIIPDGVKVAHLRDRDLLCDYAVNDNRESAATKQLPLFISDFRNRESVLIQPDLVERALRHRHGDDLPEEWSREGSIADFVREEILGWCKDCQDDIPVKVQEYNRGWIRRTFEQDNLREGEKLVSQFIRTSWTEPILNGDIPWKLVDGRDILKRIRKNLESFHLTLPEACLVEEMAEEDFDEAMRKVVELVYSWCHD